MLDWLRTSSPALRYSVYVAGAVLMFLVAVGMGSAVVVGWLSGRASIGAGHGAAMSEGSVSVTTGSDKTESSYRLSRRCGYKVRCGLSRATGRG